MTYDYINLEWIAASLLIDLLMLFLWILVWIELRKLKQMKT